MTTTIGILIFDDAEELDFVGPWEVFTMAGQGRDDVRVVTLAESTDPVRCAKGLRVLPDLDLANAPQLDVLLVPGGMGTRREADNTTLIEWIAKAAEPCTWVTSVCTGSLLLVKAGLADGKKVTTHWGFVPELTKVAPETTVLSNARYVRDGNLVTSAGVSAGIDMALWVTGQIWGPDHARKTQRFMEYDPAPPYSAVVE